MGDKHESGIHRFIFIAVNPGPAVMTGTDVETARLMRAVEVEAASAEEAFAIAQPRAMQYGDRAVAVFREGFLVPVATSGIQKLEDAYPLDAALRDGKPFAVPEDASYEVGEVPGDIMHNPRGWDRPILAVTAAGETVELRRLNKALVQPGCGFSRTAIEESYIARGEGDVVVLTVRRDERTVAAKAWLRSESQSGGAARAGWFHSLGGDHTTAAAALMGAIRHARGLDPQAYPEAPAP